MRTILLAALLALSGVANGQVVYHLSEGSEQASRAIQYLRNHLEVEPKAAIVVVAHAAGVDFLMKGARTAKGNEFRSAVEDLDLAGVKFRVCEITLRERGLKREQFLPEVQFVPSGVVEISRLQRAEGYAYLKP
jgi:intracellular sulfur oxidation DsrE/DsrF family protein